jgi:hypothetical protein
MCYGIGHRIFVDFIRFFRVIGVKLIKFFILINKINNAISIELLGKAFIEIYYALYPRDIASTRGHTPEKSIRELSPRYERFLLS